MVPDGWESIKLKEILSSPVKNGFSPNSTEQYTGYVVLGLGALTDNKLKASEVKNIIHTDKIEQSQLRDGDFLVSRSNTPEKVGRSALFRGEIVNCSYPDLMMKFRVDEAVANREFIEVLLQTSEKRQYFTNCAAGSSSTMVKITKGTVEQTPLMLPPLPEQQKIARILSTWDKAISTTEALIDNSQQQKKALMQQLLTGKKRFPGFVGEWEKLGFGEVVSITAKKYNPENNKNCLPCVELEHISQETGRIIGSAKGSSLSSIKNHFSSGNVIFGKLRPYLKKYARPTFDGVCSTEIWVFTVNSQILEEYLFHLVQTDIFISEANKSAGSKMPRADWNLVSQFVIKLPSSREQQKIASILTNADQEIEHLEQQLTDLKQEKKALMQQLLTGKRRVTIDEKEVA